MANHEELFPLLNGGEVDEESSSGYESPVLVSDENRLSDSDTEHSSTDTASEDGISSDNDEADDLDDLEDQDVVQFSETDAVISNIKYILSMPNLCDVKFEVGPRRHTIYGIKAVLGSRSLAFRNILVNEVNRQNNRTDVDLLTISIWNYDYDIFRQFVNYVHTGGVTMDVTSVVGLTCAASEFEISDLESACWDYIKHCCATEANLPILRNQADLYCYHQVIGTIRQLLNQYESHSGSRETFV